MLILLSNKTDIRAILSVSKVETKESCKDKDVECERNKIELACDAKGKRLK
jgi:hypothetical protein